MSALDSIAPSLSIVNVVRKQTFIVHPEVVKLLLMSTGNLLLIGIILLLKRKPWHLRLLSNLLVPGAIHFLFNLPPKLRFMLKNSMWDSLGDSDSMKSQVVQDYFSPST